MYAKINRIIVLSLIFICLCLIFLTNKHTQNTSKFHSFKQLEMSSQKKTFLNISYNYYQLGQTIHGRRAFSQSSIDLLLLHFGNLADKESKYDDDHLVLKSRPIFLTAFSENHFKEAMIMLHTLYKVYNCWTNWIIYDLGLKYQLVVRFLI